MEYSVAHVDLLPMELLHEVWLNLAPTNIVALACVSKHWAFVSESEGLWKAVNERYELNMFRVDRVLRCIMAFLLFKTYT